MTTPPFPFIVGNQRSGTTLVRALLDSHPELSVPPESWFVAELARPADRYEREGGFDAEAFLSDLADHPRFSRWALSPEWTRAALLGDRPPDYPEAIRRVFALFATSRHKPRYADKTPTYVKELPLLARLFPEARFVHVIRDGRDVALSFVEAPWGPDNPIRAALDWSDRVAAGRRTGRALGRERYLEVRYEQLVEDPEHVTRRICKFLELKFDSAMFSYPDRAAELTGAGLQQRNVNRHIALPPTKGLRDWRSEMAPADVAGFELVAGDLLEALGYERSAPAVGADLGAVTAELLGEIGRLRRRVAQLEEPEQLPTGVRGTA